MLNPEITKYIVKWDGTTFHQGITILDKNNSKIGSIKDSSSIFSRKLQLLDNANSIILQVSQRKKGMSENMDIKDPDGKILGWSDDREVKNWFKKRGEIMILKNSNAKEILYCKGKLLSPYETKDEIRKFYVNDLNEKAIFNIECKIDEEILKKRKIFSSVLYKNTCIFNIVEPEYDRKLLFGFFMTIISHVYSKTIGGGPGA